MHKLQKLHLNLIQSLRMETKELKEKVTELEQELSK